MYGHGANNNKITDSPGRKSRVFSCVPALWTFPGVVVQRSGVTGRQGDRDRATKTAYFHALCGNCKENLAKARIKTEISRKTRKFLPKNLHKAKICRTFAMSKRKTNMKHFEENEKVYIGRTAAYYDWREDVHKYAVGVDCTQYANE